MRVLVLLCIASGIARAGSNELEVGSATRALRTSSADAVTADSLGIAQLRYMRRLGDPLDVAGLELWVGGGFEPGFVTGTMFQTMATSIDALAVVGSARARYRLVDHLAATARVSLGGVRTALELKDGAGHVLEDAGWGLLASGALGVDATAFEARPITVGMRFEVGYTRTTAPAMTPRPPSPDDGTLHLAMSAASIGHLDLSGPFIAFSLIAQF
jgi:hypothetical protein